MFRLVPADPTDLTQGGRLQALQVLDDGQPIVFHDGQADADITSQGMKDLHTYGRTLATKWVTVHDTSTDGFAPFDANALAKAAGATPFKRPENGVFRPTASSARSSSPRPATPTPTPRPARPTAGSGRCCKLSQSPTSDSGTHHHALPRRPGAHRPRQHHLRRSPTSWSLVEDAGDTLHTQRNALDSGYLFDLDADYAHGQAPVRFLAEGRDASATIDAGVRLGVRQRRRQRDHRHPRLRR